MEKMGVTVPPGIAAASVAEAVSAAKAMADEEGQVVVKSQVLAGGRGLGHFKGGLQGGVHIIHTDEVESYASQMLGGTLVTKQTGPEGKPVNTLLVAKKMKFASEKYFAILLDRKSGGPLVIGCSEGGTSIEDLAEKYPEKIIKEPIDMNAGMTDAQAEKIAAALEVSGDLQAAAGQVKALYNLFCEMDCTMVEVNPLCEDLAGNLVAADAKLGFDDNAAFRQKELFAMMTSLHVAISSISCTSSGTPPAAAAAASACSIEASVAFEPTRTARTAGKRDSITPARVRPYAWSSLNTKTTKGAVAPRSSPW